MSNVLLAGNGNPAGSSPDTGDGVAVTYARGKTLPLVLNHVTATDNPVGNFLAVFSNNDPGEGTTVHITSTLLSSFDHAFAAQEENDGQAVLHHSNSLLHEIAIAEYQNLGDNPSFSSSGTVTSEPLLSNSYHLMGGSAAIKAGLTTAIQNDLDGDLRPNGRLYDIGADEFLLQFLYLPMIIG